MLRYESNIKLTMICFYCKYYWQSTRWLTVGQWTCHAVHDPCRLCYRAPSELSFSPYDDQIVLYCIAKSWWNLYGIAARVINPVVVVIIVMRRTSCIAFPYTAGSDPVVVCKLVYGLVSHKKLTGEFKLVMVIYGRDFVPATSDVHD